MKANIILLFLCLGLSMCVVASPLADPLLRDDGALRIEFSVFPNPTNGVFYLKIEDASQISYQVKVMDLIGKPIIQREITSTEDVRFDLSTSPKGIYFIQITRGQDQIIQRVVIQ